jgi:3-hydroxybutyryl-CoA dehydrogenase
MSNAETIRKISVIGAGLMGHGIAQVFAIKGYKVNVFDKDPKVLGRVLNRIQDNLQRLVHFQAMKPSEVEQCSDCITICHDMVTACDGTDLVIEAVSEDLKLKQAVFANLERMVSPRTILCSNTSAISIGKITDKLECKERVVGTHFWNPPYILPCVEVIKSEFTSVEVFQTVLDLMKKVGKEPVKVLKDIPGFIGNRMQHALWREAMSLVEKGVADAEDIDRVVKYGFGLRLAFLGPLETADLAGLDLVYGVHKDLFPDLETNKMPSAALKSRVDQGDMGVKTGRGFYSWTDERIRNVINQRDSVLLGMIEVIKKCWERNPQ